MDYSSKASSRMKEAVWTAQFMSAHARSIKLKMVWRGGVGMMTSSTDTERVAGDHRVIVKDQGQPSS